jgi:hypothetical protein
VKAGCGVHEASELSQQLREAEAKRKVRGQVLVVMIAALTVHSHSSGGFQVEVRAVLAVEAHAACAGGTSVTTPSTGATLCIVEFLY